MKNGKYLEHGNECWYLNDQRHRTDGPSVIWPDGSQEWWINGKLHRTDGPAVTYPDGTQWWYLNGEPHRVDGPAVIYFDGYQSWCLNGKKVNGDTFNFILGCTMEELIPYIFYPQYKDYKPLVEDRLRRNKE
jgi:hypothetical protein